MCTTCEWKEAINRLEEVTESLPSWKTRQREFYEGVAETVLKNRHVTERQLEVIQKAEDEAD